MTIEDWRAKIDALDQRLLDLLSERTRCVIAIGKIKNAQNLEILDPDREQQVIRNILRENKGPLDDAALQRIFEAVIDESRRIEKK